MCRYPGYVLQLAIAAIRLVSGRLRAAADHLLQKAEPLFLSPFKQKILQRCGPAVAPHADHALNSYQMQAFFQQARAGFAILHSAFPFT